MGRYLNSRVPFEAYKEIAGTRFFVDTCLQGGGIVERICSAFCVLPAYYHRHGHAGTVSSAVRKIKSHDVWQLNGRRTMA